ncbi:hypothetical protein D3C76_1376730 [compost metagenome]
MYLEHLPLQLFPGLQREVAGFRHPRRKRPRNEEIVHSALLAQRLATAADCRRFVRGFHLAAPGLRRQVLRTG